MKTLLSLIIAAPLAVSSVALAADTPPKDAPPAQPEASPAIPQANKDSVLPTATNGNGTNELRMNFRGASLDQVLTYFTEAAGFIINVKPGTSVRGKVDIWSAQPVSKEEALNLLDSVLIQ